MASSINRPTSTTNDDDDDEWWKEVYGMATWCDCQLISRWYNVRRNGYDTTHTTPSKAQDRTHTACSQANLKPLFANTHNRHIVGYKSNTTTTSLLWTNKKKIGKNKYNGQCNKLMYGSRGMKNINVCASNLESKNVVRLVYLFFPFMFSSISNLLLFFFVLLASTLSS